MSKPVTRRKPAAGPAVAAGRRRAPAGALAAKGTGRQVSRLFDSKAAGWSAKYAPGGRLAGRLSLIGDAVRRHVPSGAAVLDLGCGSGDLARHLAAGGLHVTGCDISPSMVAAASAGAGPESLVRWLILEPDWRTLPFASASFEAVVASGVLEYMPDPAAALRECARILRPGGTLHATVPDLRHPVRWLEAPLSLAARVLPGPPPRRRAGTGRRAAARQPSRLAGYLIGLQLSRQRHLMPWWRAAGARAGLLWRTGSATRGRPQPLRLILLHRPVPEPGRSAERPGGTERASGTELASVTELAGGTELASVTGLARGTELASVTGLARGTELASVTGLARGTELASVTGLAGGTERPGDAELFAEIPAEVPQSADGGALGAG